MGQMQSLLTSFTKNEEDRNGIEDMREEETLSKYTDKDL